MNVNVSNLMSGINEIRILVQHDSCECKCGLNESVCNWKQKWNRDKCQCECKELDDWSSCEKRCLWNPSKCVRERNKACKIDEYLHTKNCSWKKRLISKLVLECEDETLNTTETSPDDKKITSEKINCLVHTISLVIICLLLLAVVSVVCYYYYIWYWIKEEYVLSY